MRWIKTGGLALLVILAGGVLAVRAMFGSGDYLDDRSGPPRLDPSVLETVADLDYPPGNIAVSESGRIFFTLHPDGHPPNRVLELVDGKAVPYPNELYQRSTAGVPYFQSVLSLRIDRRDRLWTLDFADFGRGEPRLLAFDLSADELVHEYVFPSSVAGLGSMLNDFQISPDGRWIYIAETSPLIHTPALIVYDTKTRQARRLLERHDSVMPRNYVIKTSTREMIVYGIYNMRIGVDSIALDHEGEWLYYGPVSGDRLYRIRTADLRDPSLTPKELAARVEDFAAKTLSDGLTMDAEGNVYLSDMEHDAIHIIKPDRMLETLVRDPRLRWRDGFSFGPDGWLYVTCSALQHVLFRSRSSVAANAPYQIYRFRPGFAGVAGH